MDPASQVSGACREGLKRLVKERACLPGGERFFGCNHKQKAVVCAGSLVYNGFYKRVVARLNERAHEVVGATNGCNVVLERDERGLRKLCFKNWL